MLSLLIVLGPVMWLDFAMIGGIELLVKGIDTGQLAIPTPPDAIRAWLLIRERGYPAVVGGAWDTNTEAILLQAAPYMKTVGAKLLSISQWVAVGLLHLVGSISDHRLPLFPRAAHRQIHADIAAPGFGP